MHIVVMRAVKDEDPFPLPDGRRHWGWPTIYPNRQVRIAPHELTARMRLGTYQIQAPLGTGGMGEVRRARHSKVNRDVAIKARSVQVLLDRASVMLKCF
jgi:serine/threonine protein kinase